MLALCTSGDLHGIFRLVSSSVLLVMLGLGLWWSSASRRYLFRGSSASVRAGIPDVAWPELRRQVEGRRPVDPARVDVVLELAHQQRRLAGGQIAFLAFFVPLLLGEASGPGDRLAAALAGAATTAFAAAAVHLVVLRRRREAVIRHLTAHPPLHA